MVLIKNEQFRSIKENDLSNENETFEISFECNYKEAITRLIFHALVQNTNVLVCLKHPDVLALMVFVYALYKINEK